MTMVGVGAQADVAGHQHIREGAADDLDALDHRVLLHVRVARLLVLSNSFRENSE